MASIKERGLELQQAFVIQDDRFRIPEKITELPHGPEIERLVTGRSLWQERPKGEFLFIDTTGEGEINIVKPGTWQLLDQVEPPEGANKYNYSGLLTLSPHIRDISEMMAVVEVADTVLPLLNKSSPVFILEEKGVGFDDLTLRKKALGDAELVNAKIFPGLSPDYLLWESRKEKVRARRKPVDLTSKEKRYHQYLRKLWRDMVKEYQRTGFALVEPKNSQILARLKASKMPHLDMEALKLGFGVEVKNEHCGCHWRIDMKGGEERLWHCGGCEDMPFEKKQATYKLNERIKTDSYCFDCVDTKLYTVYEEKERKGDSLVELCKVTKCPTCGDIGSKKKTVFASQIID